MRKHLETVAPAKGAAANDSDRVRTLQGFSTGSPQRDGSDVQDREQVSEQDLEQSAERAGKRLERARQRLAWLFEDLLDRYARTGKAAFSRRNLAARWVGDNETIVRKWANGRKPMPLAALLVLPDEVVEDLIAAIREERKRGGRP